MNDKTTHTLNITDDLAGTRLDKALDALLPDISRERLKNLIKDGAVCVDGAPVTQPAAKMRAGMVVTLDVPPVVALDVIAQDIPIDILYEDDHLIVVNKPAGMAVHPAAGTPDGTLVNALLHHCKGRLASIGGVERPGIVHRLDKDTSGVMVVAKDDKTHQSLVQQFQDRSIERQYVALCYGVPAPRVGRIEGNIGRHPKDRKKMTVLDAGGKPAATNYKVLESFSDAISLVTCKLESGRTHQIRVHMTHIGHNLVGDPVYGKPKKLTPLSENVQKTVKNTHQQMLHAQLLGFFHPISSEFMHFETKISDTFAHLLAQLRAENQ